MEVIALCVCVFSYLILITPIPADDDNLIILDPIPGQEDCQSHYINACYVDVSVCALFQCFYVEAFRVMYTLYIRV